MTVISVLGEGWGKEGVGGGGIKYEWKGGGLRDGGKRNDNVLQLLVLSDRITFKRGRGQGR